MSNSETFEDYGEWMLVQPGGPQGPFWGIVSSSGPGWVVVLQAASEGFARLIVREHNESLESDRIFTEDSELGRPS